jgi:hypothetical protein
VAGFQKDIFEQHGEETVKFQSIPSKIAHGYPDSGLQVADLAK